MGLDDDTDLLKYGKLNSFFQATQNLNAIKTETKSVH